MAEPSAERPSSPSGTPLAAFTWADVRSRPAGSETYLLATSGRGGGPHVVPVLGVWREEAVYRCSPSAKRRGSVRARWRFQDGAVPWLRRDRTR